MKLKPYEIYSERFSQVIISDTLIGAAKQFMESNPEEVVIFAEDVEKRREENRGIAFEKDFN